MQKSQATAHVLDIKASVRTWGCIILMGVLAVFFDIYASGIRASLSLCYTTVIPTVFPFMIISSLLIKINGHKALEKLFSPLIRFLFNAPAMASCSIILGFLCGYPIGSSTATSIFDKGDLSKKELERLLTFINNPSYAFMIGGVGMGLFGSARLGVILYLSVILSAVLCGILTRSKHDQIESKYDSLPKNNNNEIPLSYAITSALTESASAMLNVCACVIFFSIPGAMLTSLLSNLGAPSTAKAIAIGFWEISGGVRAAASITDPICALIASAACCAWSGISVHMQIFSVCRGRGVSFKGYILSKLAQSIMAPIILLILLRIVYTDGIRIELTAPTLSVDPRLQPPILILFGLSLLLRIYHRLRTSVI